MVNCVTASRILRQALFCISISEFTIHFYYRQCKHFLCALHFSRNAMERFGLDFGMNSRNVKLVALDLSKACAFFYSDFLSLLVVAIFFSFFLVLFCFLTNGWIVGSLRSAPQFIPFLCRFTISDVPNIPDRNGNETFRCFGSRAMSCIIVMHVCVTFTECAWVCHFGLWCVSVCITGFSSFL